MIVNYCGDGGVVMIVLALKALMPTAVINYRQKFVINCR